MENENSGYRPPRITRGRFRPTKRFKIKIRNPMVETLARQIKAGEDISSHKTHAKTISRDWCSVLSHYGQNLLQTAIKANNKEAFDLLLPFYDVVNLETKNAYDESALMVAVVRTRPNAEQSEYFITELIENGAFIHTRYEDNHETCLHVAIVSSSVNIVQLLLEKGIDVNVQDKVGSTALHTILRSNPGRRNFDEKVALLMYYNADPGIEDQWGLLPFDYAVQCNQRPELQEVLFNYTFDKGSKPRIHIETVIQLGHQNSPLFSKIVDYNMKVYHRDQSDCYIFDALLELDTRCLKLLARKCSSALGAIISWKTHSHPFQFTPLPSFSKMLASSKVVTNLGILLESKVKPLILAFIQSLNSDRIVTEAVQNNTEEVATEILLFYLSHGVAFGDSAYHTVYEELGYCDLFKMLLYMGFRNPISVCVKSTMPRFMYDISYDLDMLMGERPIRDVLPNRVSKFPYGNTIELVDYFVHPKLSDFLWKRNDDEHFSGAQLRAVRRHPKVPLLLELARNSFRKHFIRTFGITSTSQFYTYIDKFPISYVHRKILTYETRLY